MIGRSMNVILTYQNFPLDMDYCLFMTNLMLPIYVNINIHITVIDISNIYILSHITTIAYVRIQHVSTT